jgi:hypothetical protein
VKNHEDLILISGIPPSMGGVGRLIKNLLPIAHKEGYVTILKRESLSVRGMCVNLSFIKILTELNHRILDSFTFFLKTYFLKNKSILFVHPQTAGMGLLNRLIQKNKIYLYVMDNSFFCIRSYNVHPMHGGECLNCLGNPSHIHPQCYPFPIRGNSKKMVDELWVLKKNVDKIIFLAQNLNQERLLKNHFGSQANCIVVGMDTNELSESCSAINSDLTNYDVVFHGSGNIAKGALWFVEVAKSMPSMRFFMPCSKKEIENLLGNSIDIKNIDFIPCSWDNGLKDIVKNAKIICVPSLWSAPIEGALLKSIAFNGNVAVVRTKYGFSQEIPGNVLLHLSSTPSNAALEICEYLAGDKDLKKASHAWLKLFNSKNSIANVFKAVN